MSNECARFFYDNFNYKRWNGFRLIAIDGTEVLLPKNKEAIKVYGEFTTNCMRKKVVLCRASKAYDVLNDITVDAELVNRKIGERTLAKRHLKYINPNSLILLDRGYPSYDLFMQILNNNNQFCARVAVPVWNVAKKLVESGEKEIIAEIIPGSELKSKYREKGICPEPIKARFICITLKSGDKEVLITSLLDKHKYPHELFEDLYHLRWTVEESYKKDKHRLQMENFSGKSVTAVQQDFMATMLLGNITSLLSSQVRPNQSLNKRKYQYKINMTTALAKVKEVLAILFTKSGITRYLKWLYKVLAENIVPIRPNRHFDRIKHNRKRYHRTYLAL